MSWFSSKDYGEARSEVVKNCKEGVDPRSAIGDWGDMEEDSSQEDHDRANGRSSRKDEHGTGYPSAEETAGFYDTLQPEDIKIKKR